jgi:hypothetical protein
MVYIWFGFFSGALAWDACVFLGIYFPGASLEEHRRSGIRSMGLALALPLGYLV